MRLRTILLAIVVAVTVWFSAFQDRSVAAVTQRALDAADGRPARTVLIVGNSRTYTNHMPEMLRKIADSAGSPTKFQIEMAAYPGATFRTHWEKPRSRNLLGQAWDDVVLQAESGAQATRIGNDEFLAYGAKLGAAAHTSLDRPCLLVGWAYDPKLYEDRDYIAEGYGRADHIGVIKEMHAKLASDAKLCRINVLGPWEAVRLSSPSIQLTTDGNHPSVAGTYLYALATYARLSHGPVAGVTYVPSGLDPADAKTIREAVDASAQLP